MPDKLFGHSDPLGSSIRVTDVSCEVIGVLEAKGQWSFGADRDGTILVPIWAFQRRIAGNADVSRVYVAAEDDVDTAKV